LVENVITSKMKHELKTSYNTSLLKRN